MTRSENKVTAKQELEHLTDGTPCWCNPDVYPGKGDDGDVIVHRSFDS